MIDVVEKLALDDLEHVFVNTKAIWEDIKDNTIFITGGTGFFGKWLLSSFIHINKKGKLNNKAIVLTRNKESFLSAYPQYNVPELTFIEGNIIDFEFPEQEIDYIIHAATEASVALNLEQPLLMYDTIVNGTKRILELARVKKVKSVLHTSSGAVYGEQPTNITHVSEDFIGSPNILNKGAAYGEGKRVAEMMASIYYRQFNVPSKIARCYAFVGPHLPLDAHFAIGNFMKDVLDKKHISIKGDGTPRRSYLYAADLAIWLWSILLIGENNCAYNVGSDKDLSIEELATLIAGFSNNGLQVEIADEKAPGSDIKRYVPSIEKAMTDLGLKVNIDLEEAIKRTFCFYDYNSIRK